MLLLRPFRLMTDDSFRAQGVRPLESRASEPPSPFPKSEMTPGRRFWSKVEKTETCWLWLGAKTRSGRGLTQGEGGGSETAPRTAWRMVRGAIPSGLKVLHRCDVPGCVRPEHLYLGTQGDNMRDMARRERGHTRKLTAEQVRVIKSEHRRNGVGGPGTTTLARRFGVSPRTIWLILAGKTWKHLT